MATPLESIPLPFGAALRARRISAGLSLQALADQVHFSRSHLSKVENGIKAATPQLARLCDAVLRCQGQLARLLTPRAADVRFSVSATVGREMLREDLGPRPPATSWLGPLPLDEFQATLAQLRRLAQVASPRTVMPALIGHGCALAELATGVSWDLRDAYYRLAARFIENAGWMAQELGYASRALSWTDWAAELAAQGGEDLTAFRYLRHGDLALYAGDAQRTLEYATLSLQHATDTRTRGLAAQRLAHGHALAGDDAACLQALDLSGRLLNVPATDDDQPVLGSSTVADHEAMARGWCLYDLAQPEQAARILAVEVDRLPPLAVRTRTRFGARLARAQADGGDLDQACASARPVLQALPALQSATTWVDVSALEATLRRHRRHPAVSATLPLLAAARARTA